MKIMISKWKTRRRTIVFFDLLLIALFQSVAMGEYIYFDDGGNHVIGDDTYQNDSILLDRNIANLPGTSIRVIDGGSVSSIGACSNSSITVDGGLVSYGASASDNGKIEVSKWDNRDDLVIRS